MNLILELIQNHKPDCMCFGCHSYKHDLQCTCYQNENHGVILN